MKKIITKNGIIAGIIVAIAMIASTYVFYNYPKATTLTYVIGFSGMFLGFAFIVKGIKDFKTLNNNLISFATAFKIGILIALIASTFYVIAWLIELYAFFPDFMEKYAISEIANAKPDEVAKKTLEVNQYREYYKNPFMIILMTYFEIFPMGLVVALVSSLILMKKKT